MLKKHHLNCVHLESPLGPGSGHCLLLEENGELALVDAGIGLLDTQQPETRLGQELIAASGFQFDEKRTALRQIEGLGFQPSQVKHCICTHLDPDHIGGLADFPEAKVHVSKEEYESYKAGNSRYLPQQLDHHPDLVLYEQNDSEWFGLPARKIAIGFSEAVYLIPLFGHTSGHCGVAIPNGNEWLFYVGDAYYLRAEVTEIYHPVDEFAEMRAVDNIARIASLHRIRKVVTQHQEVINFYGYHDPTEATAFSLLVPHR